MLRLAVIVWASAGVIFLAGVGVDEVLHRVRLRRRRIRHLQERVDTLTWQRDELLRGIRAHTDRVQHILDTPPLTAEQVARLHELDRQTWGGRR